MTSVARKLSPGATALAASAVEASRRLAGRVLETPLVHSAALSAATGADVWLKLENRQRTGSFKLRGAFNRLLAMSDEERSRGAVAASSGNHGAAMAHALKTLGMNGVIFVPESASVAKVEAIRAAGGRVEFFGSDGLDTEEHARDYAQRQGMVYVSPYNDAAVVAGQGSCGVEIVTQLPGLEAIFIAVGGGGLVSGVGSVLKSHDPAIRVIGCQPANSPVMSASVAAGSILPLPSLPTLSDGTAGGIEPDAVTFAWCRELVDEFVLVDEDAIAAAMRRYRESEPGPIEGAAGVALAGLLARAGSYRGRTVVVLVCGANISDAALAGIG